LTFDKEDVYASGDRRFLIMLQAVRTRRAVFFPFVVGICDAGVLQTRLEILAPVAKEILPILLE